MESVTMTKQTSGDYIGTQFAAPNHVVCVQLFSDWSHWSGFEGGLGWNKREILVIFS